VIKSKEDLKHYLEMDRQALSIKYKKPKLLGDEVWRFQIITRKVEYYLNVKNSIVYRPILHWLRLKRHILGTLLGFSIPTNVFGPGMSISHRGTVIVNSKTKIGKNCRIHNCVVIGRAPVIGDNCYIGPGVKIFGKIEIADNIKIGANSVVNKSFLEPGVTIAGVPAKVVSRSE
tara:strand:+ start:1317 stop:1838 length:522 start_codon:yes stop_codon:yes gene_type:complete